MKITWTSKSVVFLLIVLLAFLVWQKFKQYRLQSAIEKEKQSLQNRKTEIEGKNLELEQSLGYLISSASKDVIARQQLNMQKEGEIVYSFSENPAPAPVNEPAESKSTNFQKWAAYFLNKNPKSNK